MDIFNLTTDPFEFIESEGNILSSEINDDYNLDDELTDILLTKSTNCQQIQSSPLRPIDLPSYRKHYGLLTFNRYRIPIVFRFVIKIILINIYFHVLFLVYQVIIMFRIFDFHMH
jgi:hypothetical protein